MGIKVGIDLGTTFSAVAMINPKTGKPEIIPNTLGERITPSAIQFVNDHEIVVGAEAKEAFEDGESGCTTAFKRAMGSNTPYCSFFGKSYTAEDLSAILLRYLKEEAEAVTHQTIDEAVVTVPAYFYHKERKATMNAARRAGLKVRQIINEPTAAAMNYGTNHWRENARVLVYDLGGGTFDITLVQMKKNNELVSLQTTGDHMLGGKDWDARICDIIEARIESETGYQVSNNPEIHLEVSRAAENVKKQLTSKNTAQVHLNLPDYGRYSTVVTLEEFERNTRSLIQRTGSLCQNLLDQLSIRWSDITDILLVGGSTRMRQVSAYLKEISGHTPLSQVNPDEAVALGAAIQVHLPLPQYTVLSAVQEEEEPEQSTKPGLFQFRRREGKPAPAKPYTLPGTVGRETTVNDVLSIHHTDVVAHAMGVIAVSKDGTHYINKTIVPANQSIPVKRAKAFHYYTSPSSDNELEIYVLQGTKPPLESEIIGKYVVTGIQHNRQDNPTTIRIQYSYDVNGMVHVQVRQGNGTSDLPIREEPVPSDMSKFGRPIDPEEFAVPAAEPLNIMLSVDVSGSMSGSPIRDAKNAMLHFVDQFAEYPGEVAISINVVSDRSMVVQHLTTHLERCRDAIRRIQSCMTGVCNDGHPFADMMRELQGRSGKRIGVVLADGCWSNQDTAIREAKKCHREGIDIAAIGFGEADAKFLRAISSGSIDAMMVQQSELTRSFGKIAQEIGGESLSVKKGRGHSEGETETTTWLAIGEV